MKLLPALILYAAFVSSSAFADIQCSDVKYGNENYTENMEELAKRAKLPDDSYSRYHEEAVSSLCNGDAKSVTDLIDSGDLKSMEVEAIAEILGKPYKIKQRSEKGKSYGYSRDKFSSMGLCSACADNVAQFYTKKPSSACGVLAKQALEGNPEATAKLIDFPDFCTWK
ncbi:MAG: hypothetical protein NTY50_00805 [Methylobacter sp.]|nr:hypothetical protein [Methylobacter sp.]